MTNLLQKIDMLRQFGFPAVKLVQRPHNATWAGPGFEIVSKQHLRGLDTISAFLFRIEKNWKGSVRRVIKY